MQHSTQRTLPPFVGSLIRPPALRDLIAARESGQAVDEQRYTATLRQAVAEAVRTQAEVGLDVVSDGEFGK